MRGQGLDPGCHRLLAAQWPLIQPSERTQRVHNHLVTLVEEESQKAHPDERLLGSSEIIESVFGKLKTLEGEPPTDLPPSS